MKTADLARIAPEPVSHDANIRKRVILRKGEIPGITQLARAEFPAGAVASAHSHPDMFEVFLVESGEGSMRIEGSEQRLLPGVCVSVEPGEVHEVRCTGAEPLVLTYFGILAEAR